MRRRSLQASRSLTTRSQRARLVSSRADSSAQVKHLLCTRIALPSQLCLLGLDVHAAAEQTCCGRTVPIRSAREIEGLRAACRLAREVLDKAHAVVRPGVTTDEIDRVVRRLFRHLH